ncbi:MAG: hypothetical protein O9256_00635 [Rhizobiaceae bacterium]|nr:hypothetical protein [Rhizobiaceae bacterium]
MPTAELAYIEAVAEPDGHTSVAHGVLRTERSAESTAPRPANGGVRIYRIERHVAGQDRLPWQTTMALQEALQRVVRNLRPASGTPGTPRAHLRVGGSAGVRFVPRYQVVQLRGGRRPIAPPPEGDDNAFVIWLDAWRRNATADEVVVEVRADDGELEAIARDLEPPVDEALEAGTPRETDASAARRNDLVRDWLTAADVSERMHSRATNRGALPSRLRRAGELLGVWVPSENGYRHPDWQFSRVSGRPYPEIKEILALLRGPNGLTEGRPTSGWEEVEWFLQPRASLGGVAPATLLATDAARVRECAHKDVSEDRDASW